MTHDKAPKTPQNPADAIRELAQSDEGKSLSARIRKLLPVIEAAHRDGVTHARIVARLCDVGMELSFATYEKLLHRARKAAEAAERAQASPGRAEATKNYELPAAPPQDQPTADPASLWRTLSTPPEGYDPDE